MRSLNTNTAPTDQPTVGCKSGKGDRTRRGNERKSETKKNRSEKTTEVAERGGGGEEVQWIGGGKRLQGVLSTRKELAIGPSHRRFVSCHVRILNFQPSIQPNSRTGHQLSAEGKYVDALVYSLKNPPLSARGSFLSLLFSLSFLIFVLDEIFLHHECFCVRDRMYLFDDLISDPCRCMYIESSNNITSLRISMSFINL